MKRKRYSASYKAKVAFRLNPGLKQSSAETAADDNLSVWFIDSHGLVRSMPSVSGSVSGKKYICLRLSGVVWAVSRRS